MTALLTWLVSVAAVAVVLGLVWFAILCSTRATRLRLLDERVTLARGALVDALDRRVRVAREVVDAAGPDAPALAKAAGIPAGTDPSEREGAENLLSAAIAHHPQAVADAGLVDVVADAQTRVTIARRFYNDAVRDTRALRGRRMVRWLRLGGRAPMPAYFEIAEA